jgi:hypothetical protein
MPETRSAVEILTILAERVRRLERDAAQIAQVLEKWRDKNAERRAGTSPKPDNVA